MKSKELFSMNLITESASPLLSERVPVIFLDIDGVLRPESSLFYATFDQATYAFSPIAVGLLNRLCYETKAELVISSDWRKFGKKVIMYEIYRALAALNSMLSQKDTIIPLHSKFFKRSPDAADSWCTPVFESYFDRGKEIDWWLGKWGHWIDSYCILDDIKRLISPHQTNNFVWIERSHSGFDMDYYEQALQILENPLLRYHHVTDNK